MDSLRARFQEAKQADDARNTFIEELLQKVGDMQKTMDRNAFVLVLIDGDGMNFLDDLVKKGIAGGEEASTLLRREIFNELRYDPDFTHDEKIVIKVCANLRGLGKTYAQHGILSNADEFANFVLGFNKAHPLCDFIDAGNHKEGADKKLQETLNLFVYNVHCKHIILGASTDNTYASSLNSFHDIDIEKRIRLLKGPPFAYEFKNILHRFRQMEFPDIFRSEKIGPHSTRSAHSSNTNMSSEYIRNGRIPPTPNRQNYSSSIGNVRGGEDTSGSEKIVTNPTRHTPTNSMSKMLEAISRKERIATIPTRPTYIHNRGLATSPSIPNQREKYLINGSNTTDLPRSRNSWEIPLPTKDLDQEPPTSPLRNGGVSIRSAPPPPPTPTHDPTDPSHPRARDVDFALINSVFEVLAETPRSCDFGIVRRKAEQKLGVSPNFFQKDDKNPWYEKSQRVCKWAVEEWMQRTNRRPPGNATWLISSKSYPLGLSTAEAFAHPSAALWKTKGEPMWARYVPQEFGGGSGE